ncbi:MAG: putative hydrolase YxeP [Anaerolineales bacterium]|nr:putative hydrolase YxeP [Anaerolineales bacterium]
MLKNAHTLTEELIEWRRDLHQHPEIGFDVQRTAAKVADELEKMGYRVTRGVGRTGVTAEIGAGTPVVALRADMDALPILEQNAVEYVSQAKGKMHACGHDAHTSMALGAAQILSKEKFNGRVRFLFQPSEETADEEGKSGAERMAEDGCMNEVDFVIAQHVDPHAPVGTIGISSGAASAGVDSWFAEIRGVGGHGAHPDKTIDPFVLAAHVIIALNSIISRRVDPFAPAVVSIGSFHGGFTENVIPESVKITGTLRYMNLELHQELRAEIRRAFEVARTLGGNYELKFEYGGPPMINEINVAAMIEETGVDLLGRENVHELRKSMGAEDFGAFLAHAPGAMFTLGTRGGDETGFALHHPRFDIDERALPIGTALLAETALRLLKK